MTLQENSATLGHKHRISFKCGSCGTEVLVERHIHEDGHAHPHQTMKERYRLHPKRA